MTGLTLSPQMVVLAFFALLASQLAFLGLIAKWAGGWIEEKVAQKMDSPTGALGTHKIDPLAHEPMRRQMMVEWLAESRETRAELRSMREAILTPLMVTFEGMASRERKFDHGNHGNEKD